MQPREIDARGLACPQPVVLTKQALESGTAHALRVLVDNANASQNVTRLAQSRGCTVTQLPQADGVIELLIVAGDPGASGSPEPVPAGDTGSGRVVFLFDSDYVGTNRDLGKVLTNGFMNAALALDGVACDVVLISNGVRLAVEGTYVRETLEKLQAAGARILLCGTCLDFFKIRDKVLIGTVSNALEILECLTGAAKVVKF